MTFLNNEYNHYLCRYYILYMYNVYGTCMTSEFRKKNYVMFAHVAINHHITTKKSRVELVN